MKKIILFFVILTSLFICLVPQLDFGDDIQAEPEEKPTGALRIVYMDNSISDFEKSIIAEAALNWQKATNNMVRFIFVYDPNEKFTVKVSERDNIDLIFVRPVREDSVLVAMMDLMLGGDMLGYCNIFETPTILYVVPERFISVDMYKAIVTHELGHSIMGPGHLEPEENSGALMTPSYDGTNNCLTKVDLEWFCSVYQCKAEDLKFCPRKESIICSSSGY